ncbi:MAG: insulinase family protein [Bacteroidales bacterium]|jgi:predicted Zn-dependent peptidase|nr:insulinase family protein [Bacteroidales bacterium]
MYHFSKFILNNGFRIVCNEDKNTALAAVNMLYGVGSKHESSGIYGIAHLFEHLMFCGSLRFPEFDARVENFNGESNAFTSNDITNYYVVLPAYNLSEILETEADRMQNLLLDEQKLNIQKQVVIEEFKQRYLNVPYGDLWQRIRELCYAKHPYRRQTIGTCVEDIEGITLNDARNFYNTFYCPQNAVLSICGSINTEKVFALCKKYFNSIPQNEAYIPQNIAPESLWTENRCKYVTSDVPVSVLVICFQMCSRREREYYIYDLISDLLSNGKSSQFYVSLVANTKLFTEISASVSGDDECGLFIIMGKLSKGTLMKQAEEAVWKELKGFATKPVSSENLQKVKNKNEANNTFGNMKVLERSMNMAYYTNLGDTELLNTERDIYDDISANEIWAVANQTFLNSYSHTLYYMSASET